MTACLKNATILCSYLELKEDSKIQLHSDCLQNIGIAIGGNMLENQSKKISQNQFLSWISHTLQKRIVVRATVSEINYTEIFLRISDFDSYSKTKLYCSASYSSPNFTTDNPTISFTTREYIDYKKLKEIIVEDKCFPRGDRILVRKELLTWRRIDGTNEHTHPLSDMTHPLLGHHFLFLGILKMKKIKYSENPIISSVINELHRRYACFLNEMYK